MLYLVNQLPHGFTYKTNNKHQNMKKELLTRIIMVGSLVFITGLTITMTALGVVGGTEEARTSLSELYTQKSTIDQELSVSLLKQAEANKEVETLRDERSEVQKIIDEAIHKPEQDFHDLMIIKAAEEDPVFQ